MTKNTLHILFLAIAFCFSVSTVSAQKKGAKKAAVTAPVIDVQQYVDNPICKVMILDSVVVEKSKLLENLVIPESLGRIFVDDNTGENAYENGFGDQRLIAKIDNSGHHNIYRQTLLGNTWSEPEAVSINGNFTDIFNPFMTPDGQTLYFAAKSQQDNNTTNLSLYMTTYDSQTQSFLTPKQLPYPFTSSSDDMYYIEDDADSLAWFVSSRRQISGNVCIYTMRIHEPWIYYDTEEKTPSELKSLANIENIKDTWDSTDEYNAEKQHLDALRNTLIASKRDATSKDNIYFVGMHDRVYTKLSDFSSDESRNKYKQLIALEEDIKTQERQLEEFRRVYHNTMEESKSEITQLIIESEQKLSVDKLKARQLAIDIRKNEK